jgi:hypothetical protein
VSERRAALDVADNLGLDCAALLCSRTTPALADEERAALNAALARVTLSLFGDTGRRHRMSVSVPTRDGVRVVVKASGRPSVPVTLPTALVLLGKMAGREPLANYGRERPSKQKTRGVLVQIIDAMKACAPDSADVHKALALILMLNDLDTLSVFWRSDDELASTTGAARLRRLAAKLRDMTRDKPGEYAHP